MTEISNMKVILQDNEFPYSSEIYKKLSEIGCCKICCFRFCGETSVETYKKLYNVDHEDKEESPDSRSGSKRVANNPCIACLGVLQSPIGDKIIDQIVEAVSSEEYDNPNFNIAFSLPISFYLRAHSILIFLLNNYPKHVSEHLPLGVVTVGVKDAWRYVFAEKVANRIKKNYNIDSSLMIRVDIQYEDDHSEISCLLEMYPDKFKAQQKIKIKGHGRCSGPTLSQLSRKTVDTILDIKTRDLFGHHYPIPPTIPSHAAFCNNVQFEQAPIFFGGRYNKYIRGLPQTAWLVHDERKLETSVHELIGESIEAVTKAQGSKLIASGREDVDVRMLGSGRPFALELINPRHVVFSKQELTNLECQINKNSKGRIAVNQLTIVNKSHMEYLKLGEEHKSKTYVAYCVAWGADESKLANLNCGTPIELQQRTPVRVLHRRPIATRPRTVNWMNISNIKASHKNKIYFTLELNTQAGTYIKEFVHGDFGRTKPNIGDLLGGVTADCLALDVKDIGLKWPL